MKISIFKVIVNREIGKFSWRHIPLLPSDYVCSITGFEYSPMQYDSICFETSSKEKYVLHIFKKEPMIPKETIKLVRPLLPKRTKGFDESDLIGKKVLLTLTTNKQIIMKPFEEVQND